MEDKTTEYMCFYCGVHFTLRDDFAEADLERELGIELPENVSVCRNDVCITSRGGDPIAEYRKRPIVIFAEGPLTKARAIHTLEGGLYASVGDYVITGAHGEKYPCKPDIFEQTYQRVEREDES